MMENLDITIVLVRLAVSLVISSPLNLKEINRLKQNVPSGINSSQP